MNVLHRRAASSLAPRARAAAASSLVALSALLGACAGGPYAPTNVHPGDSQDDVLRVMGPPTASYTMPDGHLRLEYNRMPAGRHTFMIDFDAQGRVSRWENVLDENHFAAILPGMDRADVLRLIGPPSYTWHYARPSPGITWLYRFETIQRCILFEVAFDASTGRVLDGDYPPDPGCAEPRG